jgi:signal transduction histidine kinase
MAAEARQASRRRWRVTLFYLLWTAFVCAVAWWLAHPFLSAAKAPLVVDSSNTSPASVGQQIKTWLQLADLNFRGAYPWILLAPYIVLLAACFPLERGRWKLSLPVHLAAAALFILASGSLLKRVETAGIRILVIANNRQEGPLTWPFPTNFPDLSAGRGWPDLATNVLPGTSQLGQFTATTVIGAYGGSATNVKISISTDPAADGPIDMDEHLIARESLHSGSNLEPTTRTLVDRVAAWAPPFADARKPFSLLLDLLAYGALVGSAHAVHFNRRFRERADRARLLESHLASARLHALQAQLHPHFLFNALNAVATLIRHDPDAALETLTSFSELLRLALSQSEKQEIPLRDDLRFLQQYVEIQKVRLGDRFRFEQDVDTSALDCLVPALLLQPLVENSLRHGIEPSAKPGTVRLSVRRDGAQLRLSVEDNGAGLSAAAKSNTGIGLSNLRARLQMLYGGAQTLELGELPTGGVAVRIVIPARMEEPGRAHETAIAT